MGKAIQMLVVVVAAALLSTTTITCAQPVPGDVGRAELCVPTETDDDNNKNKNDECRTCVMGDGKNDDDDSIDKFYGAKECVDACAQATYTIVQLDDYTEYNDDEGQELIYRSVEVIPSDSCIDGCYCPKGIGYSENPVVDSDDDKNKNKNDRREEYEMEWEDSDGNLSRYYIGGVLRIEYDDDDDDDEVNLNQVRMEIEFGNGRRRGRGGNYKNNKNDKNEERCEVMMKIVAGRIGGIDAISGEPASVPATQAPPNIVADGIIKMDNAYPESCNTLSSWNDWCARKCFAKFVVETEYDNLYFAPAKSNVEGCKCPYGVGKKNSSGYNFDEAQAYFGSEYNRLCTAAFAPGNISHVVNSNSDYGNKLTISYLSDTGTLCTFAYEVVEGRVMEQESLGTTTFLIVCIIISALIVIGFAMPSIMPKMPQKNKPAATK